VFPAVYAVGHDHLTSEARGLAAVLACGPGACTSHRFAAWVWGWRAGPPERVDVIARRSGRPGFDGAVVHRPRSLPPEDVTVRRGVPVTSVPRTLLDLGDLMSAKDLLRQVRGAEVHGVLDLGALAERLERANGRRGARTLRRFLSTARPERKRSGLEQRFLRLCDRAGLPRPRVNTPIDGTPYEVDFLWPDQRLIVETDGRGSHHTLSAFEEDRRRDAHLATLGFLVIRFTYARIRDEPATVVRIVRDLLLQRGWAA
jgi:very-short-patch-repair endonuclease